MLLPPAASHVLGEEDTTLFPSRSTTAVTVKVEAAALSWQLGYEVRGILGGVPLRGVLLAHGRRPDEDGFCALSFHVANGGVARRFVHGDLGTDADNFLSLRRRMEPGGVDAEEEEDLDADGATLRDAMRRRQKRVQRRMLGLMQPHTASPSLREAVGEEETEPQKARRPLCSLASQEGRVRTREPEGQEETKATQPSPDVEQAALQGPAPPLPSAAEAHTLLAQYERAPDFELVRPSHGDKTTKKGKAQAEASLDLGSPRAPGYDIRAAYEQAEALPSEEATGRDLGPRNELRVGRRFFEGLERARLPREAIAVKEELRERIRQELKLDNGKAQRVLDEYTDMWQGEEEAAEVRAAVEEFINGVLEYSCEFAEDSDIHDDPSLPLASVDPDIMQMHISVKEGTMPIRERARRLAPEKTLLLQKEIQKLIDMGVAELGASEWSSPFVLVKKPGFDDATHASYQQYRVACDLRRLNKVSQRVQYEMLTLKDVAGDLSGACLFSGLDVKHQYWRVEVAPSSRKFLSFHVPGLGSVRFRRMPMGHINSAAWMGMLMEMTLNSALHNFCLAYADDVLVFTRRHDAITSASIAEGGPTTAAEAVPSSLAATIRRHTRHLVTVLQRLWACNLRIKPAKAHLLRRHLQYLGVIVGSDGVRIPQERKKAMAELAPPRNLRQLRGFIGLVNFFKRFVPAFSKIALPLYELLKNSASGRVVEALRDDTGEAQRAVRAIKDALVQAPTLALPCHGKRKLLFTDASEYAIGWVLMQIEKEKEGDTPARVSTISYGSAKLSSTATRYNVREKEALAIVTALDKLRPWILGEDLSIFTDHKSLTWLHEMRSGSGGRSQGKIDRWCAFIGSYDPGIFYVPGEQNGGADALSRLLPALDTLAQHPRTSDMVPDDLCYPASVFTFSTTQPRGASTAPDTAPGPYSLAALYRMADAYENNSGTRTESVAAAAIARTAVAGSRSGGRNGARVAAMTYDNSNDPRWWVTLVRREGELEWSLPRLPGETTEPATTVQQLTQSMELGVDGEVVVVITAKEAARQKDMIFTAIIIDEASAGPGSERELAIEPYLRRKWFRADSTAEAVRERQMTEETAADVAVAVGAARREGRGQDQGITLDAGFGRWRTAQAADAFCRETRAAITLRGQAPAADANVRAANALRLMKVRRFSICNGLLYRTSDEDQHGKRHTAIVVPRALQKRLIANVHKAAGHAGCAATVSRLRRAVWFRDLRSMTRQHISRCRQCQRDRRRHRRKAPYRSTGYEQPFDGVAIDFMEGFEEDGTGKDKILTVVDLATQYVVAYPFATGAGLGERVAERLRELYNIVGVPLRIRNDRGKELIGKALTKLKRSMGIGSEICSPRRHTSNSLGERVHDTMRRAIRKLCGTNYKGWQKAIGTVTQALNTTAGEGDKPSPFEQVFARPPRALARLVPFPDTLLPKRPAPPPEIRQRLQWAQEMRRWLAEERREVRQLRNDLRDRAEVTRYEFARHQIVTWDTVIGMVDEGQRARDGRNAKHPEKARTRRSQPYAVVGRTERDNFLLQPLPLTRDAQPVVRHCDVIEPFHCNDTALRDAIPRAFGPGERLTKGEFVLTRWDEGQLRTDWTLARVTRDVRASGGRLARRSSGRNRSAGTGAAVGRGPGAGRVELELWWPKAPLGIAATMRLEEKWWQTEWAAAYVRDGAFRAGRPTLGRGRPSEKVKKKRDEWRKVVCTVQERDVLTTGFPLTSHHRYKDRVPPIVFSVLDERVKARPSCSHFSELMGLKPLDEQEE